ncbi:hypothetical protein AVEN_2434-1 [Araneus ventricosus]|uniref:Uncharacterized protein n=1 Tax=Araneus ventricosus TaxID=182803 RepID=A0A4Y2IKM8_ARAVE|nr:hypothetical protein AVEN_2434-1 [Araneus ventricosus]
MYMWSYLSSGSSIPAPIPRQPKQPSEASKFEIEREDFPCLGLGRGKTLGSRIAADIYSHPGTNKKTVPVRSYSAVVGNKMNNTTILMNDTKMNINSITGQQDITGI